MYKKFLKIDFVFIACCDIAGNDEYNEYVVIDGGVVILYKFGGVDDIIILFIIGGVDKDITLFELEGNDGVLFNVLIIIGVVIGNVVGMVIIGVVIGNVVGTVIIFGAYNKIFDVKILFCSTKKREYLQCY